MSKTELADAKTYLTQLAHWKTRVLPPGSDWYGFEHVKQEIAAVWQQCNALCELAKIEHYIGEKKQAAAHVIKAIELAKIEIANFPELSEPKKSPMYQEATKAILDAIKCKDIFNNVFVMSDTAAIVANCNTHIDRAKDHLIKGAYAKAIPEAKKCTVLVRNSLNDLAAAKPMKSASASASGGAGKLKKMVSSSSSSSSKPSSSPLAKKSPAKSPLKKPSKLTMETLKEILRSNGFEEARADEKMLRFTSCLQTDELITGEAVGQALADRSLEELALLTVLCVDVGVFINSLNDGKKKKWVKKEVPDQFTSFFDQPATFFESQDPEESVVIRAIAITDLKEAQHMILGAECELAQNMLTKDGTGLNKKHDDDTIFGNFKLNETVFKSDKNVNADSWNRALHSFTLHSVHFSTHDWYNLFKAISPEALLAATQAKFNEHSFRLTPQLLPPFVTGKFLWYMDGIIVGTCKPSHSAAYALAKAREAVLAEDMPTIGYFLTLRGRIAQIAHKDTGDIILLPSGGDGEALLIKARNIWSIVLNAANKDATGGFIEPSAYTKFQDNQKLVLDIEQAGQIIRGFLSGCARIWQFQDDGSISFVKPDKSDPYKEADISRLCKYIKQGDLFSISTDC